MRLFLFALGLLGVATAAPSGTAQPCPSTCDAFTDLAPGAFPGATVFNTGVYADDAFSPDARVNDPGGRIAGCIGGELRGVSRPVAVENDLVHTVAVRGEPGDFGQPISFRYCSPRSEDAVAEAVPSANDDNTPTYASGTSYGQFRGPYRLVVSTTALPVELLRFEATGVDRRVRLSWATASETANAGFGVEYRTATAGDAAWEHAGFIPGGGTTSEVRLYAYETTDLAPGTYAFRLRQVDLDGATSYSPETEVALAPEHAVYLRGPYPNPSAGLSMLEVYVSRSQRIVVTLYDMLGRRVANVHSGLQSPGLTEKIVVDVNGVPVGVYLLRVQGETFGRSLPLSVAR